MLAGVAIFGAATIAFGLSRTLWLSVLILVVMGGSGHAQRLRPR